MVLHMTSDPKNLIVVSDFLTNPELFGIPGTNPELLGLEDDPTPFWSKVNTYFAWLFAIFCC